VILLSHLLGLAPRKKEEVTVQVGRRGGPRGEKVEAANGEGISDPNPRGEEKPFSRLLKGEARYAGRDHSYPPAERV